MNFKLLIPSLVIIAAVIGGVLWWFAGQSERANEVSMGEQQQSSPTPTATPKATSSAGDGQSEASLARNVVVLTDDGFEPANIVVPAGSEVRFVNQSEIGMWIASDPHPDHSDLSGFDQGQEGESFSFTFEEPGAYTYHNESDESQTGLVLVEE